MSYIDGFVAAVPTGNREAYREHALGAGVIFREHGALSMVDCWGDDVPDGKVTSFPMAVKKQEDETIVFSWVIWPTKAARDAGMAGIMADPRMRDLAMPFDGQRLIYGGFELLAETP